jgi:hypothetical protein
MVLPTMPQLWWNPYHVKDTIHQSKLLVQLIITIIYNGVSQMINKDASFYNFSNHVDYVILG